MTADEYLRRVSLALRDLPWGQRRDLVAELREHLAEMPPETDFPKRLGSPEKYAADLRAAAGLERRHGPVTFIRSRRPRDFVLVAALALAIGGVTAVLVIRYERQQFVKHYQPLGNVGAGFGTPGMKPSLGQDGYTVFFRKGRPFEYGIGLINRGRYTVRILGALSPGNMPWLPNHDFFTGRLMMATDEHCQMAGQLKLEPFHPFAMQPGACRFLIFDGVFACGNTARSLGHKYGVNSIDLDDFFVRYRFRWRTATAAIRQEDPLEISFRKEDCPKPGKR